MEQETFLDRLYTVFVVNRESPRDYTIRARKKLRSKSCKRSQVKGGKISSSQKVTKLVF